MTGTLSEHRGAALIIALFVTLATTYSLVTPVFEASDEISHYPVVEYIATTGQLPVQKLGVKTLWDQEGSQPPLYYMIGAGLTFWINTSDLASIRTANPHRKLGIPLDPDNKNMILHTEAESFPWNNAVLAVHLLRFLGIALGAISVGLCYVLGLTVWPQKRSVVLLATALTAFNPMFLFITGSVNNDNLIVTLGTWTLLLCVRVLQFGLTTRRTLTLAVVTALGTITKISGLALIPLVGLVLLIHAWRTHAWQRALVACLVVGGAWLLLASWWYIRNLTLYGELLGINMQCAIAGCRQIALWDLFKNEWQGFWISYWALFGAVNVLADEGVYDLYGAITIVSIAGLIWWCARQGRQKHWSALAIPAFLAVEVTLVFVGLVRWTLMTQASQGRLMFPAIAAISLLMALGLISCIPQRWHRVSTAALSIPLAAIAAIAPFRYIAPTYERAPIVTEIPPHATPVGVIFDGLELVAVETQSATVYAGDFMPITLYWRATRPLTQNYSIFLHALGRSYQEIGKIDSYPGGGTWPTTRLKVGQIIKDSYQIELKEGFVTPTVVRVQVGVGIWQPDSYTLIEGTRFDGTSSGNVIVEVGVAYPRETQATAGCHRIATSDGPTGVTARFGNFAVLHATSLSQQVKPGASVPVRLVWEQVGDPSGDWTVFVQMLDQNDKIVAQADAPPVNNDYPTRLWRIPCQVEDVHTLKLPADLRPGNYRILVGFYDASQPTYPRAEANTPDGSPYPGNAVPLGTLAVETP